MQRWLFFSLLLLCSGWLAAQAQPPASVFLESAPLGARIRLDGELRAERTPTLLRGVKPGSHSVVLFKDGYESWQADFTVDPAKVSVVRGILRPASLTLIFPETPKAAVGESTFDTYNQQFRIPLGNYRLESQDGTTRLTPIFPDEHLRTFAGWGIPALFVVSSAATANAIYISSHHYPANFPAAVPLLWTAFLGDVFWYLALQDRAARFEKLTRPQITAQSEKADFANRIFQEADDALQDGQLEAAVTGFSRLIRDYPESIEVPGAWFKLARIHSLTGDRVLAKGEYRLVAEVYQQSDYYDKARKALADLFEAENNTVETLYHLQLMAYTDPLFDRADITAHIAELQKTLEPAHAP